MNSIFNLKRITTLSLTMTLALFLIPTISFAQNTAPQDQKRVGPLESTLPTYYIEPKVDPFFTYVPDIKPVKTPTPPPLKPEIIPPPSFEERDAIWKQKRTDAIKNNQPSPLLSEKYIVEEIKVLGLYKKPEGQGAFLKPTPVASTTIFVMVGQKFWNGEIKKIDKDKIEVEVTILLSNGKTKTEVQSVPFIYRK